MNYNKSHSYFQIRQTVITKLEMWIMNPKIFRPAQDLLLSVAVNCTTHSPADVEVIGNFTKLRFKNKPNINLYLVKKSVKNWSFYSINPPLNEHPNCFTVHSFRRDTDTPISTVHNCLLGNRMRAITVNEYVIEIKVFLMFINRLRYAKCVWLTRRTCRRCWSTPSSTSCPTRETTTTWPCFTSCSHATR